MKKEKKKKRFGFFSLSRFLFSSFEEATKNWASNAVYGI